MFMLFMSPLLRFALRLDAAGSSLVGALTLIGKSSVATWLGASAATTSAAGLFMLSYGLTIGWFSTKPRIDTRWVWVVIAGNSLWMVASLLLAGSDWIQPSTPGIVLLVGQALAVAVFAGLQYVGLGQSAAVAP